MEAKYTTTRHNADWRFVSSEEVVHKTGMSIKLCSGTWEEPLDLDISRVKDVRLIREGLVYATMNQTKVHYHRVDRAEEKKAKTKGRSVLSLRKNKSQLTE